MLLIVCAMHIPCAGQPLHHAAEARSADIVECDCQNAVAAMSIAKSAPWLHLLIILCMAGDTDRCCTSQQAFSRTSLSALSSAPMLTASDNACALQIIIITWHVVYIF